MLPNLVTGVNAVSGVPVTTAVMTPCCPTVLIAEGNVFPHLRLSFCDRPAPDGNR